MIKYTSCIFIHLCTLYNKKQLFLSQTAQIYQRDSFTRFSTIIFLLKRFDLGPMFRELFVFAKIFDRKVRKSHVRVANDEADKQFSLGKGILYFSIIAIELLLKYLYRIVAPLKYARSLQKCPEVPAQSVMSAQSTTTPTPCPGGQLLR